MSNRSESDVEDACQWSAVRCGLLALDVVASTVFWYVLLFQEISDVVFYSFLGVLLLAAVSWRIYRACTQDNELPYTVGHVVVGVRELYIVATVHISPRSSDDVEKVIDVIRPDLVMIELDLERFDRLRGAAQTSGTNDLQSITVTMPGSAPTTVEAQRAIWNAEFAGEVFSGDIFFDAENPYGLAPISPDAHGALALVRRGDPSGSFAPFAVKAHDAARRGAEALLVINREEALPESRIGAGSLWGEVRIWFHTWSCGFPPIPVLLLPNEFGEQLAKMDPAAGAPQAELEVLEDDYPRRTLRRRLCQAIALTLSGIGILYGIIQCFAVEVGKEFLSAEEAASARGITCVCIDVDMDRFWSRLGSALLPTPCNVRDALLAWLAFPRVLFRILFPTRSDVDCVGGCFLHALSFHCRTWVAFILAGLCASFVTSHLLQWFGHGVTEGAEKAGMVREENGQAFEAWMVLAIEFYMLPRIYDAVAASRDEAMYRSVVQRAQDHSANRLVAVVGAGHANGMLQYARQQGL